MFSALDELFAKGKLSNVQARFGSNYRPSEELYDLNEDPYEINNLATDPKCCKQLERLRQRMKQWIESTDDKGPYAEGEPNLRFTFERRGGKCINPE